MDTVYKIINFIWGLPWSEILKWASIGVNVIVLFKYIRSKVTLSILLTGRWEGYVEYCGDNDRILDCTLIVSDNPIRANRASFYYKQVDGEKISVRGLDELNDYDDDYIFIFKRKWKPVFYREFHVAYNNQTKAEQIDTRHTIKYHWDCDICNILTKPKLKVFIWGNNVELKGVLHRA